MKQSSISYISIILIVFAVVSCKVGPNYHKPETTSPETFRFDQKRTDSITNLKWWDLFNDEILDSLIYEALENNKNVLIAASRVEQARANVGYTKADMGPKFGYGASAGRTNNIQGIQLDQPINSFSASAGLNWEIDFWGKFRRGTEAAKADMVASLYGKRAVEIALISEVATNYFLLLDYRTQLEISKNTLASRDSTLIIIQERFNYGYTHIIDVNQAQIQKAIAQASVPQFKRFVAFTENNLSVLLGKNPDSIETLLLVNAYELPETIPTGLTSDILQRRPDVLQAEQFYRSQNARVGQAVAMRFPSISLTGLLGVGSTELSTLLSGGLGWSAGASLTGPLFEWGKNKRRVEIEREKAKQSLLTYENIVLTSFQEVSNALIEIETLKDELAARQLRVDAAKNASYLSRQRYFQGITSYLEVTENQRQEFDAQLSYSDNYQQLLNSYVNLYKALGGGWVDQDEIDKYAQQKADQENIDVNTIDKDSLFYNGQVVDLHLTQEEIDGRKADKKAQRKLEREQKKADRQNKK